MSYTLPIVEQYSFLLKDWTKKTNISIKTEKISQVFVDNKPTNNYTKKTNIVSIPKDTEILKQVIQLIQEELKKPDPEPTEFNKK